MYDLSILIPARNEVFLSTTIDNILENIEGKTEIIVVLDGQWADPPVIDDPRVTLVYYPESIGQRGATNKACSFSSAKYVMKADAHCAFDKGFDVKMMAKMQDDLTMVPVLKNLHAFDWICNKCGKRWFQGPTPTYCHLNYDDGSKVKTENPACDNTTDFRKDMIWKPNRRRPSNGSFLFDSTPHFQYFKEYERRPEFKKDREETGLTETMSLQGSCFMITRDKYWELNICDEAFGSWGSQGIEVACKTWLSGGRVVCNWDTWYAHMFRTQGGDFGFPYPLPGHQVKSAKEYAKNLFITGRWEKQIRPFSWLLKKFWPVRGWEFIPEDPIAELDNSPKGIIFYTDNQLPIKIANIVQGNLRKISRIQNIPIVSASLKPMNFGKNVYLPLKRGYLTMFKQILASLEASTADIIFHCEHDVLYHPSHFDFIPPRKDVYYYNTNVWKVRYEDGHAMRTANMQQLSGLCAYRETLIRHYRERVRKLEAFISNHKEEEINPFVRQMGFEPGTHNRPEKIDDLKAESWESKYPNVDIRHNSNLTSSRWKKEQFRNQKYTEGWQESDEVKGWGKMKDLF